MTSVAAPASLLRDAATRAPARAAMGELTLAVRRDLDWPAEDLAALDRLIALRPHVGLFLSKPWLSGFFADPPAGEQLSIVELREDGVLRGLIPLTIRRARRAVHIGLLGGGLGSDRVDLLAARGFESRFADMILEWIRDSFGSDGYTLRLRDVPDDSPLWAGICRAMHEQGIVLVPREVNPLPYISLDELNDGAARDVWRNDASLTKHRRWLEHRGELRVEIVREADEAVTAFDRMVDMLDARWGAQSATRHPRVVRFHRHAIPLLAAEGRLRMVRLLSDARLVAVCYAVASGSGAHDAATRRWWAYYLAGYDRAWAGRIHLGRVTVAATVDMARCEEAAEFDFLKGAEPYKYYWPVRDRVTIDADVYSSKAAAQLERARHAGRELAAALMKSTRSLWSRPSHATNDE